MTITEMLKDGCLVDPDPNTREANGAEFKRLLFAAGIPELLEAFEDLGVPGMGKVVNEQIHKAADCAFALGMDSFSAHCYAVNIQTVALRGAFIDAIAKMSKQDNDER